MKFIFAAAAALLATIAVAGPIDLDFVLRAKDATKNVTAALNTTENFKVLARAIQAAGLADALDNAVNVTVLAPSNAGFAQTLEDLGFDNIPAGQDKRIFNITKSLLAETNISLTTLLQYHVLTEKKSRKQLNGSLTTLAGADFSLSFNGSVFTDVANLSGKGAKVAENDLSPENATIFTLDRVLLHVAVNPNDIKAIVDKIKKENPGPEPPICFPASSIVHTADGQDITMADLAAGHSVKVSESSKFSPVFLFSHKQHQGLQDFVRVTAVSGHSITLSASHYMYANGKLTAARAVKVGDTIRTVKGPAAVKSVEMVKDFGLVAPHTLHGDIVVNGVVASTYTTTVHPRLAHFLLAPVRAVVRMGLSKEPLGSTLYDGAPRFSKMVPSGPDMF